MLPNGKLKLEKKGNYYVFEMIKYNLIFNYYKLFRLSRTILEKNRTKKMIQVKMKITMKKAMKYRQNL